MYYVIKRQKDNPLKCFIGFQVPKYIASKNNDNVIFEFKKDGKAQRKWVAKDDIVLLTEDKETFVKTMNKFREVEETQQKLIDEAQKKLDESVDNFTQSVNDKLDEFDEIKSSQDVPCILRDL